MAKGPVKKNFADIGLCKGFYDPITQLTYLKTPVFTVNGAQYNAVSLDARFVNSCEYESAFFYQDDMEVFQMSYKRIYDIANGRNLNKDAQGKVDNCPGANDNVEDDEETTEAKK